MESQKFKNSSLKENKTKDNLINSAKTDLQKFREELAKKYNMTIEEIEKSFKNKL